MRHTSRFGLDVAVPFVILALVFGGMLWQKYQEACRLPEPAPVVHPSAPRKVVLYFGNDRGQLVPEGREIENCEDPTSCIRSILDELFSGPIGDLDNVFPEWTTLNSVTVAGDTATIDLGADFVDGVQSGSSPEMMAIFGIVNTVTANIKEISRVRITIDGNPGARLRHLDLSEPLIPDNTIIAPPVAEQQSGTCSLTARG
jgi:hypothetical protein